MFEITLAMLVFMFTKHNKCYQMAADPRVIELCTGQIWSFMSVISAAQALDDVLQRVQFVNSVVVLGPL